jgi:chromosome segregation ATPase
MTDPTHTPTDAVSRARSRRERLAAAADELEQAVTRAAADPAAWKAGVASALVGLGDALAEHVTEVEGPDGLYQEILERSPRLAHDIARLRADHDDLRRRIAEIEPMLPSPATLEQVGVIRDRVVDLLAEISRHRHRGADLIWESYEFDIGAGD